jgi:uncharacterized Zn-binding protein involved in type VI secretion
MPNISRVGDTNEMGGQIMRGATSVLAEGQPVGLHPSTISPHAPWDQYTHPPHEAAQTTTASVTVLVEGQPVLMVGSMNTCGHSIIQGALSIQVI